MKHLFIPLFLILLLMASCRKPTKISDWRGPDRNGIYPEKGLLQKWPEKGPELLWSFEGLGYGHSSPAVLDHRVFVTGMKDTIASMGTLFVFDEQGNKLYEKEYGKDFSLNFHGTRSAPVVVDDRIYIESGMGAVYCLNTEGGEEIWSKDFILDFGVDSVIQFGYSESVLIDGDQLICVPGGKENNVVALNRFTGELIWSCPGEGEIATYNSPILINHNGHKLVIAMTSNSVMGIDAETGEKYWRVEQIQQNKIHANTPLYADGKILVVTAGREKNSGMVQMQLSEDGKSISEVWRNNKFINLMGGLIQLDTCLYGSSYLKKDWQVISWNTGETLVQNKELGGGSVIYADNRFYCYAERDGEVALAEARPESFEIISRFSVPMGTNEHWAHLVIHNGILYVRHGDALMAYNIKAG
ncbi:PQQ-binding-like beta-propeller repeat protein [Maribellus sp. YY47]|uniref:outer membrane protein assembly factor BamB family protein n=1 Tax=Maribellus sp. YY47 TaxID=2929486 RepID=UPI0020018416|nr:PQQ-binding-like beta-propeller repeat protein [Maribellus sp. YY47]MCK3686076.1 PQQ-binding-like beta-propeller repeat protein [Maribellus sp. YY47]